MRRFSHANALVLSLVFSASSCGFFDSDERSRESRARIDSGTLAPAGPDDEAVGLPLVPDEPACEPPELWPDSDEFPEEDQVCSGVYMFDRALACESESCGECERCELAKTLVVNSASTPTVHILRPCDLEVIDCDPDGDGFPRPEDCSSTCIEYSDTPDLDSARSSCEPKVVAHVAASGQFPRSQIEVIENTPVLINLLPGLDTFRCKAKVSFVETGNQDGCTCLSYPTCESADCGFERVVSRTLGLSTNEQIEHQAGRVLDSLKCATCQESDMTTAERFACLLASRAELIGEIERVGGFDPRLEPVVEFVVRRAVVEFERSGHLLEDADLDPNDSESILSQMHSVYAEHSDLIGSPNFECGPSLVDASPECKTEPEVSLCLRLTAAHVDGSLSTRLFDEVCRPLLTRPDECGELDAIYVARLANSVGASIVRGLESNWDVPEQDSDGICTTQPSVALSDALSQLNKLRVATRPLTDAAEIDVALARGAQSRAQAAMWRTAYRLGGVDATTPQSAEGAAEIVANASLRGIETELAVLRAALAGAPDEAPLATAPLLTVIAGALAGVDRHARDSVGYHDLACRYIDCAGDSSGPLATRLATFIEGLADVGDGINAPAACTRDAEALRLLAAGHQRLENAMTEALGAAEVEITSADALAALDGDITIGRFPRTRITLDDLPPEALSLAQLARSNRLRFQRYAATGLFDDVERTLLARGVGDSSLASSDPSTQRLAVRTELIRMLDKEGDSNVHDLDRAIVDERQQIVAAVSSSIGLVNAVSEQQAVSDRVSQLDARVAQLGGLIQEMTDRGVSDSMAFASAVASLNSLIENNVINLGAQVNPQDIAFDANETDVKAEGFLDQAGGSLDDLAIRVSDASGAEGKSIAIDAGSILSIETSAAWSPTCALHDVEIPVLGVGVTNDFIENITPPPGMTVGQAILHFYAIPGAVVDLGLDALGALIGFVFATNLPTKVALVPSDPASAAVFHDSQTTGLGYSLTLATNTVTVVANSESAGFSGQLCGGAQSGGGSGKACLNIGRSIEETDSVSESMSASFSTGIRSPSAPFPFAPVGALLAVTADSNDNTLDVRVIAARDALLFADSAKVYFVVNDRAPKSGESCGVSGGANDKLTVSVRITESVEAALDRLPAAIANLSAAVRPDVDLALEAPFTGSDLQQKRGQLFDLLNAQFQADIGTFPPSVQSFVSTFISGLIAELERFGTIGSLKRERALLELEIRLLIDDVTSAEQVTSLSEILPQVALRDTVGADLRVAESLAVFDLALRVPPVLENRYPLEFQRVQDGAGPQAAIEAHNAAVGLTELDFTSADFSARAILEGGSLAGITREPIDKLLTLANGLRALIDSGGGATDEKHKIVAIGFPRPTCPQVGSLDQSSVFDYRQCKRCPDDLNSVTGPLITACPDGEPPLPYEFAIETNAREASTADTLAFWAKLLDSSPTQMGKFVTVDIQPHHLYRGNALSFPAAQLDCGSGGTGGSIMPIADKMGVFFLADSGALVSNTVFQRPILPERTTIIGPLGPRPYELEQSEGPWQQDPVPVFFQPGAPSDNDGGLERVFSDTLNLSPDAFRGVSPAMRFDLALGDFVSRNNDNIPLRHLRAVYIAFRVSHRTHGSFSDGEIGSCDSVTHEEAGREDHLECFDGLDNDGDSSTDCEDESCVQACETSEFAQIPGRCDDGVDNDDDGLSDCQDPGCALACPEPETSLDRCEDEEDNDFDGDTDCADSDCIEHCEPDVG